MAASARSFLGFSSFLLALALLVATVSAADEKETRLRVYWHDVVSGPNATNVQVVAEAPSTNASATGFGSVAVIDNPITEGPSLNSSKLIGRAQGMYISAGKDSLSLLMTMNFVFMDGAYNGSSLAIFGPNQAAMQIREVAVVGGTGLFRFARGYCQLRTQWFNASTGDATVEYTIHIRH